MTFTFSGLVGGLASLAPPVVLPIAGSVAFGYYLASVYDQTQPVLRVLMGYIINLTAILEGLFTLLQSQTHSPNDAESRLFWQAMIKQTIGNYKEFKLSETGSKCHADIRNFVGTAPNIFSLDYRQTVSKELVRLMQAYRFRVVQEWIDGRGQIVQSEQAQRVESEACQTHLVHPGLLQLSSSDSHLINIPQPSRSVGGGGYCDLFIGIYTPTGAKLAMKRPRFSTQIASAAATAKRRFVREAKTWSSLKHGNILPFYGLIEISDEVYLVSPWMDYGDLSKFVGERMVFLDATPSVQRAHPRRLACNAFKEVDIVSAFACGCMALPTKHSRIAPEQIHGIASGLAYLHTHEVIHGDLKALNVLLTEQLDPLICDFGMTKMRDVHNMTSTAMQGVGSCGWMSPEIIDGNSKTDKSDIYAFGMVIVEASVAIKWLVTQQLTDCMDRS
ncbi:hypothetical protein FRB96_004249 [Tulasnella sp. 330]|nr:hypothetical protein FRB96_004249 [Tulasnella sp. 330]